MDSSFEQVVAYLSMGIPECAVPLTSFLVQMKNRCQEEKEELEGTIESKIKESVSNRTYKDAYEQLSRLQELNERIIDIDTQINYLVNEHIISLDS